MTLEHPTGLRLRIRQAPNMLRRMVRHPAWVSDTVRGTIRRRHNHRFSLQEHAECFLSAAEAVAAVTRTSEQDYRAACADLPPSIAQTRRRPAFGARPELVRIVYAIVRLVRPEVVVETGVAQGLTAAAMLEAMERNQRGHLYSVDLPVLYAREEEFVGRMVPDRLRGRWTLRLGPSRRVLGPLVEEIAPLDLFLHDADHSYESQLEEYGVAWPRLRAGGILVSDDVGNPAFLEFASEHGAEPLLVGTPTAETAVGLLRKPG